MKRNVHGFKQMSQYFDVVLPSRHLVNFNDKYKLAASKNQF